VLRVDPATGGVTARVRFPASVQIDSLTLGLQAVWVVASSSATLYRIDPRSARVTGHRDLGERAGRPNVRFGYVWVGVSDGGSTVLVDARTLMIVTTLNCCTLEVGSTASGYGSIWMADSQTGEIVRFDGQTKQIVDTIAVTDAPAWGGPCMTSIAAGAGGVWVTAAPPYACPA
jgi:DNA-binding beta-propeller fold protein YncE